MTILKGICFPPVGTSSTPSFVKPIILNTLKRAPAFARVGAVIE
jgi:hypothetical protein